MVYLLKTSGTGYYAGRDMTGAIYNRARKYAIPYSSKQVAEDRAAELNSRAGYRYYKVVKVSDTVRFKLYPGL